MTSLTLILASTILFIWADMMLNTQENQRKRNLNLELFYSFFLFASVAIFVFTLFRTLFHGAY